MKSLKHLHNKMRHSRQGRKAWNLTLIEKIEIENFVFHYFQSSFPTSVNNENELSKRRMEICYQINVPLNYIIQPDDVERQVAYRCKSFEFKYIDQKLLQASLHVRDRA